MAKPVSVITLGIDVSKSSLDIHRWDTQQTVSIANTSSAIQGYFDLLDGPARIAIEPTGQFHIDVVEVAMAGDHQVYLVNPRQVRHYRDATGVRAKTDQQDAWLLARYLMHEAEQLRPFVLHTAKEQRVWQLIKRRAKVVKARTIVQQSLNGVLSIKALNREYERVIARIEHKLAQLVTELGWQDAVARLESIPGIGWLTSVALVAAYHRGSFASSDAFVAFLGLDVRVRDSGLFRGIRKLTKRGEPELRRLLYCGVTGAIRTHAPFRDYVDRLRQRGQSTVGSRCVLARKLVRIAFALLKSGETFSPQSA